MSRRALSRYARIWQGTVFLAIRDDQTFEKKVTVKMAKHGLDSESVLDRFR
jgi:eukaryotic-like serine/threonine-protein kinase